MWQSGSRTSARSDASSRIGLQTHTADAGFWFESLHGELLRRSVEPLRARDHRAVRGLDRYLPSTLPIGRGRRKGHVLILTSWAKSHRFFPHSWWREPIVYAIDCWPGDYDRWEALLRSSGTKLAMFSARSCAEEFARRMPELTTAWVPEYVDPAGYRSALPLSSRPHDLMLMGRRYQPFEAALRSNARTVDLAAIAPSGVPHTELRRLMGASKSLACFPRTMTHPEKARGLETMTLRYLEGIAAGCVLVGHSPSELVDLFGYDPCLEATEPTAAVELMSDISANPGSFQDLVDRNLDRLLEIGTAERRAEDLLTIANHFVATGRLPSEAPAATGGASRPA